MPNDKKYEPIVIEAELCGTLTCYFRNGIRCIFSRKSGSMTLECRGRVVDVFPFEAHVLDGYGMHPNKDAMKCIGPDQAALLREVGNIACTRYSLKWLLRSKIRTLKRLRIGFHEIKFSTNDL